MSTSSCPGGQALALFGHNGAGKSTLLRTLATLVRPDSGNIRVAGFNRDRQDRLIRSAIGYVGHDSLLYDDLTPVENLRFYARLYGVRDAEDRTDAVLRDVGAREWAGRRVRTLSNGMRKRVAIARALLHRPRVLLLDEPETGLDEGGLELLEAVVRAVTDGGASVAMTTHGAEQGLALADQVAVLSAGRVTMSCERRATSVGEIQRAITGRGRGRVMAAYLRVAAAVFMKDIRLEARTKETATAVLVFALMVAFVFGFAFDPAPSVMAIVGPGVVWVAYLFAGILGMNRTFAVERDRGTLEGLMLAPVGREAVFAGKLLGAIAVMLVVEALMVPVFLMLYDLSLFSVWFILAAVLATIGFAAVGTLFSAIAAHTRAREAALPVLFLPVSLPVIIAAVGSTSDILDGGGWSEVRGWLQLMLAFDVVFLVLSSWAFEFVLEE